LIQKRLPELFLLLASMSLLAGVAIGLTMGATHDYLLRPVHAHTNHVGWVSIALFGLTYRSFPGHISGAAASLHLFVSAASALLFPLGLMLEINYGDVRLIAVASLLWLLACVQYLLFVIRVLRSQIIAE
jgi:hypothetical protein